MKSPKQTAKRHRRRSNIVNNDSIPDRGGDDAYGNPFAGLSNKLAANDIGNTELAPDAVLNANIGEQINASKLPNIAGLNGDFPFSRVTGQIQASRLEGTVPDVNLPNLAGLRGDLPFSRVEGKLGAGRINWNKNSVPKFAISGVNWDDVDNKPRLASKGYVDKEIDQFKKWANNRFSQRGHNHN